MSGCYFVAGPIVAVALLSASFGAPCRAQDSAAEAGFSIEEAALGAEEGARFPRVQAAGDRWIVSWTQVEASAASTSRGRAQLRFAVVKPSRPPVVRTAASGDDWFVNWADLPGVVSLGAPAGADSEPFLVAHWLQRIDDSSAYSYGVRWRHSKDGGRSWSDPTWLHGDTSPTEHGFASVVPLGGGRGAALWLDGREMARGGAMALRSRRFEFDRFEGEVVVDPRVCECCSTAAVGVGGETWAVYRDRSEEEVRDIGLAFTKGSAWSASGSVHEDGWEMPGCPVNGPVIAAQGSRVVVAWFTLGAEGKARVLVGFLDAATGEREGPYVVDAHQPIGRPAVDFCRDGSAVVAWIAERDAAASLRVRRVLAGGHRGPEREVATLQGDRSDGRPALASLGERTLLAWTDSSGAAPSVRALWLRAP